MLYYQSFDQFVLKENESLLHEQKLYRNVFKYFYIGNKEQTVSIYSSNII